MKPLHPIGKRRIPMRAVVESLVVVTLLVIVAVVAVQFQDAPSGIEAIESGATESRALPVHVVRAGSVPGPTLNDRYSGLLIAEQESVLSFERGGRVAMLTVAEGSSVRRGDVIAELDQQNLDAAEQRIQSELAAAESLLDELRSGARREVIEAARARVQQWTARVELAKVETRRQRDLAPQGATSRAELDEAVFGLQANEASLLAEKAAYDELVAGTREEQVRAQAATCDAIRAQLKEIAAEREDSRIVAPFDGTIAERLIDEGTVVSSGAAVARLISHTLEAQVGLPPDVAATLKPGDQVMLQLREQHRTARIDRLEPAIRRDTRTRVTFARFEATADRETSGSQRSCDANWVAGEVVQLIVPEQQLNPREGNFWLPASAMVRGAKGLWSTLVLPGEETTATCERKTVEVLKTDGDRVLVQGMLNRGDRVIADGTHRLTAGMTASVVPVPDDTLSGTQR